MGKRTIRRPVGFEGKELDGYFMIANKDAAAAIASKLTGSQLRLWLYLMMADSFADRTADGEKVYHSIPSPADIALKIGVSPETVEKDMRLLRKMELYDYRITVWQGHNSAAERARTESERLKKTVKNGCKPKPSQSSAYLSSPEGLNKPPEGLNKPPEGLNKPPEGLNNLSNRPKPLSEKASDAPQTIQTYTDFIQTLSDSEREKFLEFALEETKSWEPPINDIEDFLAQTTKAGQNRWEVYYQKFLTSQETKNASESPYLKLQARIEAQRQQAEAAYREGRGIYKRAETDPTQPETSASRENQSPVANRTCGEPISVVSDVSVVAGTGSFASHQANRRKES